MEIVTYSGGVIFGCCLTCCQHLEFQLKVTDHPDVAMKCLPSIHAAILGSWLLVGLNQGKGRCHHDWNSK